MADVPLMKNYRARWKAVEEVERRETLRTPVELRWLQLNTLVQLGRDLRLTSEQKEPDMNVIRRWLKLYSL